MCDGDDKHMPSTRHPELIIHWVSWNNLAFWQGDVAFGANCNNQVFPGKGVSTHARVDTVG